MTQVDPLSSSLEIAGAFSNTGVPVEIVEAENQGVGAVLSSNNNGRPQGQGGVVNPPNIGGEEAMDISVEGDQHMDSTQLSAVPKSIEVPIPRLTPNVAASNASGATVASLASAFPAISTAAGGGVTSVATNTASISTQVSSIEKHQTTSSANESSLSGLSGQTGEGSVADHLQRVSSSAMEQLSQLGGHPPALEISADAISSLPDNLAQLGAQNSQFSSSMNFSGLDMSGTSMNASGALDPDTPSSPESNFDSSDLLSSSLLQQDEVTHRLAQSGPIGVAAAAAIMSSRKRKRPMTFETNPSLRKRHCSKLSKKLKETIDEMSMRVGLQAVVVMYKPGKANSGGSENPKNEPSFKVFGAAPLTNVVKNQKDAIVAEMEAALHQQTPAMTQSTPKVQPSGEMMHDLPPLVFDGIPTPVHKMTQAQLRTFIPNMLKFATGRGKPGWGKEDVKPSWWPTDVPWANVRSDIRSDEQKKQLPWTDALRRIVLSCYINYNRIDLLPEFCIEQLQQIFSPESTQQLQLQLETLQQQANASGATVSAESAENVPVSSDVNTEPPATGNGDEPAPTQGILASDNQQVFTVDTGMGSCDTTGMPTLADASLAETAARLQQVADETGEVQYATQTVTVTERDAKALGQPVGSTTTVLLTAYPGGHSGAATGTEAPTVTQPASDALLTTQQSSSSTNVQVVYSASHIDSISDTIGTSVPSSVAQTETDSFTSTLASSGVAPEVSSVNATSMSVGALPSTVATSTQPAAPSATTIGDVVGGGNEYLNPTAGDEMMEVGGATSAKITDGGAGVGSITNEGDSASDLAAQLISQYSSGEDGTAATSEVAAAFEESIKGLDSGKLDEAIPVTTAASQVTNTTEN